MIDWISILLETLPFIIGAIIGFGLIRKSKNKKDENNKRNKTSNI